MLQDFDAQQLVMNDLASFAQSRSNSDSLNCSGRSMALFPSNLDELFSAEDSLSPSYSNQAVASGIISLRHKSVVLNQFQQQSMLSPMNSNVFSPKSERDAAAVASKQRQLPGAWIQLCLSCREISSHYIMVSIGFFRFRNIPFVQRYGLSNFGGWGFLHRRRSSRFQAGFMGRSQFLGEISRFRISQVTIGIS
ncbi:unnamed protein product [Fraxinus pennsylvanica]|uniref:Uncharacterized protein n=1 Tax=Fraxinus pennsylvanica TaxID=56036 RepID=A0AAD1ZBR9_9LAMI|nr:unnamed protein product [Fraxinus pennsylvanica]